MKTALIIGKLWPEPKSSAAGRRMLQIIELIKEQGFAITFACAASETDYSEDLNIREVSCKSIFINDNSLDCILQSLNPTLVMFDRFLTEEQFGWKVRDIVPYAVTVLDSEDLHFLRSARHQSVKKNGDISRVDDYIFSDDTLREIGSIHRCDITLTISNYEMDLLTDTFHIPCTKLFYLPILSNGTMEELLPYGSREHFCFIGNFYHEPNWDAVLQLKKIWKDIRKVNPNSELHIYGGYPTQKVYDLINEREGFIVKGRAEDLSVLRKYKILLAPLRFGAGQKGKLFDAMEFGLPSVTTSIGSEGIQDENNWPGVVDDDFEKWPNIISELSQKPNWLSACSMIEDVLSRYDIINFRESFKSLISELSNDIHQHRKQHFFGEVLHFHSMRSTKYMSKWIEEKNKR